MVNLFSGYFFSVYSKYSNDVDIIKLGLSTFVVSSNVVNNVFLSLSALIGIWSVRLDSLAGLFYLNSGISWCGYFSVNV